MMTKKEVKKTKQKVVIEMEDSRDLIYNSLLLWLLELETHGFAMISSFSLRPFAPNPKQNPH